MIGDLSGMLTNTDTVLDYPKLMPESFINIGGFQVNPEPEVISNVRQNQLKHSLIKKSFYRKN